MDPERFREAYQRLERLDERLTYKVRPRNFGRARASLEQIDDRTRDLAEFVTELKDVLQELFLSIGNKPKPPPDTAGDSEP